MKSFHPEEMLIITLEIISMELSIEKLIKGHLSVAAQLSEWVGEWVREWASEWVSVCECVCVWSSKTV